MLPVARISFCVHEAFITICSEAAGFGSCDTKDAERQEENDSRSDFLPADSSEGECEDLLPADSSEGHNEDLLPPDSSEGHGAFFGPPSSDCHTSPAKAFEPDLVGKCMAQIHWKCCLGMSRL